MAGNEKIIGNSFWRMRTKHGRDKLFSNSNILWEACCEYFAEIEANPLYGIDVVKYQGEGTIKQIPKMRAMTIGGLCVFLNISLNTWYEYAKLDDFNETCKAVQQIIYNQKLEGAAADLLNPSIIAREIGLKDTTVSEVIDKTPGYKKLSDEELEEKLKELGVDPSKI